MQKHSFLRSRIIRRLLHRVAAASWRRAVRVRTMALRSLGGRHLCKRSPAQVLFFADGCKFFLDEQWRTGMVSFGTRHLPPLILAALECSTLAVSEV
jgi:hypothetical protein